jgi:hypothetical protein
MLLFTDVTRSLQNSGMDDDSVRAYPPHTHTPCVVRTKWASACGYVGFVFVFVFVLFFGGRGGGGRNFVCVCDILYVGVFL